MQAVFGETEKLWTKDILVALNALEESPWGGWNDGEGMRPRELANKLRPFEVQSRSVRIDDETRKGYFREQLEDVWDRYLSGDRVEKEASGLDSGIPSGTPGTLALESQKPGVFQAAHNSDVPDRKEAANPHSNAVVPDVSDRSPESKENRPREQSKHPEIWEQFIGGEDS
jgi:Protein of unknown function (DUF3631)